MNHEFIAYRFATITSDNLQNCLTTFSLFGKAQVVPASCVVDGKVSREAGAIGFSFLPDAVVIVPVKPDLAIGEVNDN